MTQIFEHEKAETLYKIHIRLQMAGKIIPTILWCRKKSFCIINFN